jgi:hypothetical protein
VVAPYIAVRWQTTDQFVLDWLKSQSLPPKNNSAPTPGISGGAIGGIVVGVVALLGLFISGMYLCLRRRKRRAQTTPLESENVAGKLNDLPLFVLANSSCLVSLRFRCVAVDRISNTDTLISEYYSVQPKAYPPDNSGPPPMSPATEQSELDSRTLSPTQYSALSNTSPTQGVQPKPFLSPTIPELSSNSPTESIAGNTLNDRSFSTGLELGEQRPAGHLSSSGPDVDLHGFPLYAPGSGPSSLPLPRSSWLEQQHKQVKEEKARLTRLQELSEMEARLEEQISRELAEEGMTELPS